VIGDTDDSIQRTEPGTGSKRRALAEFIAEPDTMGSLPPGKPGTRATNSAESKVMDLAAPSDDAVPSIPHARLRISSGCERTTMPSKAPTTNPAA
jgi:hypothetical protein